MKNTSAPTLAIGAFDRHNFGDLLFAHIAAAMRGERPMLFTGLTERDLRGVGGHRVKSAARLAARSCDRPLRILHAGGELLTCSAWEAAVMLLPPEEARAVAIRHAGQPQEQLRWASERLQSAARAPYLMGRELFPQAERVIVHAVGGVDLDVLDAATRNEVFDKLRATDDVSVRDRTTLAHLDAAGIQARLVPDPAAMTASLFAEAIRAHGAQGEPARMARAFPHGYLAVQFSTDFSDDRTLDELASGLDAIGADTGFGIAFFRAGAAPWHDDLDTYERVAARMHGRTAIFRSLHLWDICALIAGCRAYAGSSLHGRIVAMAHALPRVNLRSPSQAGRISKQQAYAATWDLPDMPATVDVAEIAAGLRQALAVDRERLRRLAMEHEAAYRAALAAESARHAPL